MVQVREVLGGVGDGVGVDVDHYRFTAVELEKVIYHPGLNVSKAGAEGGLRGGSDGRGKRRISHCL